MNIRKLLTGFVALVLTGGILLLSDLNNRYPNAKHKALTTRGTKAVEGIHYKMGLTYFAPDASLDATLKGLWKGLAELGFVKDSNLTVVAQHANGEIGNLQPIHLNMDNQDVDMILVTSTPGIAAAVATVKRHPMVFTMSYTPLEAGAGKSYTNHRPNITGVGSFPPVKKTIDFIRETIPNTKTIGTIYNSSEANSRKAVEVARDYVDKHHLKLIENTVINTSEVYQAISSLCSRNVDAIWVTGDNTALQAFHAIVKVCNQYKVPLFINDVEYVKKGAIAGVGVGWYQTGYHTASYVARVLNGEDPGSIPIENYVDERIVMNQALAEERGIKFPEKYLNQNPLKGKNYKFCLAHYVDSPNSEDAQKGIIDEFKRLGLEENIDFTLKVYNAQGDISTLNSIADAISSENWDVVFSTSTPTIQALSKKISNSPIVFTVVGDPVRAGLGKSFDDHLSYLTGISTMSDFEGMVKLVKESMPGIKTIGTIYTPGEINSVAYKERLEDAAKKQGLELIAVPANSATEVSDAALSIVSKNIQAFTQISDNLTASCGSSIIKIATDNRIPYFAFIGKQVDQGAVAAIARDYYYAGVDAVTLAKKVLEGTSPGEIPFRFVSKSTVKVNKEVMNKFKIKIPEKYFKLAEKDSK